MVSQAESYRQYAEGNQPADQRGAEWNGWRQQGITSRSREYRERDERGRCTRPWAE